MRSIHRQCRLLLAPGTWLVPVLAMHLAIPLYMCWRLMDQFEVEPALFMTNFRLIQGLTVACLVRSLLVFKRVIAPDTGKGLMLASFGVHCRLITDVILYGFWWVRDAPPWGRPITDVSFPAAEPLRHLHYLLDYGGLSAYVIGFALVLLGTAADARRWSLRHKRS